MAYLETIKRLREYSLETGGWPYVYSNIEFVQNCKCGICSKNYKITRYGLDHIQYQLFCKDCLYNESMWSCFPLTENEYYKLAKEHQNGINKS